jgi:hypothetical protein
MTLAAIHNSSAGRALVNPPYRHARSRRRRDDRNSAWRPTLIGAPSSRRYWVEQDHKVEPLHNDVRDLGE